MSQLSDNSRKRLGKELRCRLRDMSLTPRSRMKLGLIDLVERASHRDKTYADFGFRKPVGERVGSGSIN